MHFQPGTALGSYVIQERVSAGAMAVVYRALHRVLGREVALKVLSPELVDQPGFMQRFVNEARMLAQLDHPNILPVFEFGSVEGATFLSMPLVRGGTLRHLIDAGPLEPGLAWRYLREVAKALQYAHERGVVHRDVKPSNVLIHADGRGLLADFGLARSIVRNSDLSAVGIAVGTPGYMAPEQALGASIDHRADIYALGVMVFEMLTGTMPYRENSQVGVVLATLQNPIPSARERNPRVPEELDAVLARALAKRPQERQQSARELLEDLRRVPFQPPVEVSGRGVAPPAAVARVEAQAAMPEAPSPAMPSRWGAHGIPGAMVPATFQDPAAYTAGTPTGLRRRQRGTPLPMPGAIAAEVARTLSETPPPVPNASAIALLEKMGVRRLHAQQRFAQNAFFANAVHSARQVAGERWPAVVQEAAIPEFVDQDPPDNLERTTQIELPSRLNQAFETVFGAEAPEKLELWGRNTAERWLKSRQAHQHRLSLIPGQQRRVAALLRSHVSWLDGVRGEPLHAWKRVDEQQFWLVQYANLFALGRPMAEKACYFWVSALETLLRWAGLANDWLVEEIECGCVTRSFDCVFAVRSAREG